ncbi:MAG: helix-turn-helix domain-containing protein [Candidatus Limnocylindrales bacterium]
MDRSSGRETVQAWRPSVPGIREVLHATFTDHAYPPHTHDVWTLFIVDRGGIRYDLDRRSRGAEPSMVSVLPPHVVHDGRAASSAGYRKRVLYLETTVLGEDLIGPAVDGPVLRDDTLRSDVSALHDALRCRDDALEAETRLAFLAERIRATLGYRGAERADIGGRDAAEMLRAYLDGNLFEPVTLRTAAELVGVGETQLARAFSDTFGIAPHAYLIGRRLDAARLRILDGQPLADVAAEVGFCDQAHLTRRFRRFLGTTPGRFRDAISAG